MWTVYLQLAFRHFVLLGPDAEARQPGFFEVRGRAWGCCGGWPCATAWHGRRGAAVAPAGHTKRSRPCASSPRHARYAWTHRQRFHDACHSLTTQQVCWWQRSWSLELTHARSTLRRLALTPCLPRRSPCLTAAASWLHPGPHGGGGHCGEEGGAAAGALRLGGQPARARAMKWELGDGTRCPLGRRHLGKKPACTLPYL